MQQVISANDLKTKGIKALGKATAGGEEAFITVRGRTEYVVLPIKSYNKLREYELEIAVQESKKDLRSGKFHKESIAKHIKRIKGGVF